MTNYHLTPPTILPSLTVQEAKEKRRKVLETAAKVRRENYPLGWQAYLDGRRILREEERRIGKRGVA